MSPSWRLVPLAWLLVVILAGCGRQPIAQVEPTTIPPVPSATAAPTVEPTATPAPTKTPSPTPDAPPTREPTTTPEGKVEIAKARYINEPLGITWQSPGPDWTFSKNELAAPQTIPLVTLEATGDASRQVNLFTLEAAPAFAKLFALQLSTDPEQTLRETLAGMGASDTDASLTEVQGTPAIFVNLFGTTYLWVVAHPSATAYFAARGFDDPAEVEALFEGLTFTDVTPVSTEPAQPLEPEAQRAMLVANVEALRELDTRQSVPFELMGRDQLRDRLEGDVAEEVVPEEVAAEDQMWKLLGLIPQETGLLELTLDLYTAQVAGFYEPDEDTFFLISEGEEGETLALLERVTFIHEYTHALQDQHFDLQRFTDEEGEEQRSEDATRAFQALVEGDAQWVTTQYLFNHISVDEIDELMELSSEVDAETLEGTPPFLRDVATFPYIQGMAFVQAIQSAEGWQGVNEVWDNPPLSTEQILHPEKYPDEKPITVALPDGLAEAMGAGWQEPLRDVWGEFYFRLLLQQQVPDSEATAQAAAGWGGDEYLFLTNGSEGVLVMELAWDSRQDATEANLALLSWLSATGLTRQGATRFAAEGRSAYLDAEGERVRLALATDDGALVAALDALAWE